MGSDEDSSNKNLEPVMNEIRLKNFRCFRREQTARLAPLTLLVGENSTGKTSFTALVRALVEIAASSMVPDFKEEPYDLGSFDEIAHHRGARGNGAETFEAGFKMDATPSQDSERNATAKGQPYRYDVTFSRQGTVPFPEKLRWSDGAAWIELSVKDGEWHRSCGTLRGTWANPGRGRFRIPSVMDEAVPSRLFHLVETRDTYHPTTLQGPESNETDRQQIVHLSERHERSMLGYMRRRPYASAPVRSKPRRTYDPTRPTHDPEGDYVPMYLATTYFQDKARWETMKEGLEDFGKSAGMFDEIAIRPLGKRDSDPFQVQIRKYGSKAKGPGRNLIDVGYGVSQVLPVITELLRPDAPSLYLLQQPEVHLHPSAQAALGSLFCKIAGNSRQLIVETHSDHLLDRVRMDVRDRKTRLRPEDVSILFFERGDLEVNIHALRIDQEGNVLDAPPSYRRFFMQETRRSLGL